MTKTVVGKVGVLAIALACGACSSQQQTQTADGSVPGAGATGAANAGVSEQGTEWRSLFDGKTQNGWRVYKSSSQSRRRNRGWERLRQRKRWRGGYARLAFRKPMFTLSAQASERRTS